MSGLCQITTLDSAMFICIVLFELPNRRMDQSLDFMVDYLYSLSILGGYTANRYFHITV